MATSSSLAALASNIAARSNDVRSLDQQEAQDFIDGIYKTLFPQMRCNPPTTETEVLAYFESLAGKLKGILLCLTCNSSFSPHYVCEHFFDRLPEVYETMLSDADAHLKRDPAAQSIDEIILAYPGFRAICYYRIAHLLYELQVPYLPRIISRYAHQLTGVDIHPAASISQGFAIDHGTGVVIGETTRIGENVTLYQGVTLGALHVTKNLQNSKRHPTVENNVVIYANATILGGSTIIGHDSIIGGNSWITESISPGSRTYRNHFQKQPKASKEIHEGSLNR
jgi:serine O-acetyltransferase